MALPPNNKLEVPTWVTAKRPAAQPVGSSVLERTPQPKPAAADADEPGESSQPETAELGAAAAALREKVSPDTIVSKVDFEALRSADTGGALEGGEATEAQPPAPGMVDDAASVEATLRSDIAPGMSQARSRTPAIAAAAGAFVVGILLVVALAGGDEEPPDDVPGVVVEPGDDPGAIGEPPPGDQPPSDEPPSEEPPTDEPPADEPPADEPPADEPPADEPPDDAPPDDEPADDEPADDEPADDEPADDEPDVDEPDEPDGTTGSKPTKRSRRARKKPAKNTPATLVFRVVPFGEVFLDGNKLGTTPLAPVKLTPGRHFVIIKMNDKKKRMDLRVAPGERKVLRVNMNAD
jgi:hypothetical protein